MIPRLRLAVDALLHGPPAPAQAPRLPRQDAWAGDDRRGARSEAAMSLLDEDVCGFFLLTFHRDRGAATADIAASHVVAADWWPAVADAVTLVRTDYRHD